MSDVNRRFRVILQNNVGFSDAERWVEYAREHEFRPVRASAVTRCPDCAAAPRARTWGQYIYYSTLLRLLECEGCGLVWADAHLDPDIVRAHFEITYKDDQYFRVSRQPIFAHLVGVIDRLSPNGARVLDVGGARGDLMAQLVARRPDLHPVVHDISDAATSYARKVHGLTTLTGDAYQLLTHPEQYDVVVASDVLYYESNLGVLWQAISKLVAEGGSLVIRVPNKSAVIRLGQLWFRLRQSGLQQVMQDRVHFFNPEHVFILRARYLRRRLRKLGFGDVCRIPSPPLARKQGAAVTSALFKVATGINRLSRHALVLTPSMLVVGTGFQRGDRGAS